MNISIPSLILILLIGSAITVSATSFYEAAFNITWSVPNPPVTKVYEVKANNTLGDINVSLGSITSTTFRYYNLTNTGNTGAYIHLYPSGQPITVEFQNHTTYNTTYLPEGVTMFIWIKVTPSSTPGDYAGSVLVAADNSPTP